MYGQYMYRRQQAPNCPYGFIYNVQLGDTIYSIARNFNIGVEELLSANPQIEDPDMLPPGQPLCIPYPLPPECEDGFLYTIQPEDTIYSISRKFGASIDDILIANPQIEDPTVIFAGQRICIPYPEDVPECPNGFIYTVQPGDWIYSIANNFNISVEALLAANPQIIDPDLIYPGQNICVPVPQPPECPEGMIYIVETGDNIFTIAAEFDVTPGEILAANPQITDPELIFPGQEICIPGEIECPDGMIYTISAGDTLGMIANDNDLTLDELLEANPQIADSNQIFVGQKICIPESSFMCENGMEYIVEAGDSMYSIAQENEVSLEDLIAANPQIEDPTILYVGQKICIPQ